MESAVHRQLPHNHCDCTIGRRNHPIVGSVFRVSGSALGHQSASSPQRLKRCWTVAIHKSQYQTTSNELATQDNLSRARQWPLCKPMTHSERHESNRTRTSKMLQYLIKTSNVNPLPQEDTHRTAKYHSPNHTELSNIPRNV